ncbi:MAG: hypothetical protein WCA89_00445 [Terracidiphilus sp.]
MTTLQIVRLFHGKRSGNWKGKPAYMAKCSAHRDRMPSLSITEGANGATYLKCFRGCTTEEILGAKGMRMGDLFADSGYKPSPEMRRAWADEERLKLCERQHGLAIMAQAVLPGERRYWQVVERNKTVEIRRLSDKLKPSEQKQREREHEVQRIIREYGFDELWVCLPIARLQARIAHQRKGITQ